MLEFFVISLLIAVFAIVFTEVLTQSGMILGWWGKILDDLPDWLSYPLGECVYCFSGQIALWFYIVKFDYNFFNHLMFITLTIFFTLIYKNIWS